MRKTVEMSSKIIIIALKILIQKNVLALVAKVAIGLVELLVAHKL